MSDFTSNSYGPTKFRTFYHFWESLDRRVNAELDQYITSHRAENQSSSGLGRKEEKNWFADIINTELI